MPSSPVGKDGLYYEVKVNCGSSKTSGLWDYNAWRLNLDYIESNSKCNLTFTSSMSKEQYEEYIESGVALRRNTYRGKNITEYKNLNADNPMNLYNQISSGTFADIYVGDYIEGSNGVTWLIADLDNYLGIGDQGSGLQIHHATIIPAGTLGSASMNSNNTTEGGYVGSDMVKTILGNKLEADNATILGKYIYPDFGNHVLKYRNYLSNEMDPTRINKTGEIKVNQDGSISGTGASSALDWYDRYLDLMSELNVFGSAIMSSSFFDIGSNSQQYAIFKLKPELICKDLKGNNYWYWLSTIVTSNSYGAVTRSCALFSLNSAYSDSKLVQIRPRFLID